MKVVRGPRRTMIVDGEIVLSEVLHEPGPTNGLFDVLSAAIHALSPGPRVAVRGFSAGGVVPPLRAMGGEHAIDGVDLSPDGEPLFRELCASWAGKVTTTQAEAYEWLGKRKKPYDCILEDLSESEPEQGAIKPWNCIDMLPHRMFEKVTPRGVVVINLLPWPGTSWNALIDRIATPFRDAVVITFDEYENRVLIVGQELTPTRELGRLLRGSLRAIRSNQDEEIRIRTWKRG